ncbi:acyl-CoA dehydrogenase family protein [Streptomyces sp. NPDC055400]
MRVDTCPRDDAHDLGTRAAVALLELEAAHGGPDGIGVRAVLGALGAAGLLDPGPGSRPAASVALALARSLADLLTPFEAAAVAAHCALALPALARTDSGSLTSDLLLARQGTRVFGHPLTGSPASTVAASAVPGGIRLTGRVYGYCAADRLDAFLVPLPVKGVGAGDGVVRAGIVPARAEGVTLHSADPTTELVLDRVLVPEGRVVTVDDEATDGARLCLAAYELTAAEHLMEQAVRHAGDRHSFGRPLIEHQSVSFRLAELAARGDGVRALIDALASEDAGVCAGGEAAGGEAAGEERARGGAAAAERLASRLLRDTTADCLHLRGAAGQQAGSRLQELLLSSRKLASVRGLEGRRTAEVLDDAC